MIPNTRKRFDTHTHTHMQSRRRAFVAAFDPHGRVLVVQDKRTHKWMLPGGNVEPGESSRRGARRELYEESGNRPRRSLRKRHSHNGTTLYTTRLSPGSHASRTQRFHRRTDQHETGDYGYVDVSRSTFVVTDYAGRPKHLHPTTFRAGTVSHLKRASSLGGSH